MIQNFKSLHWRAFIFFLPNKITWVPC